MTTHALRFPPSDLKRSCEHDPAKNDQDRFTAERVARIRPKTYRAIVRLLADPDAKIEHIAQRHRYLLQPTVTPPLSSTLFMFPSLVRARWQIGP